MDSAHVDSLVDRAEIACIKRFQGFLGKFNSVFEVSSDVRSEETFCLVERSFTKKWVYRRGLFSS